MKKLITGAIAAMTLLLGFASCSGEFSSDLHKNDIQPLCIVGLAPDDARLPFKVISDTEQEFTFIYHHEYQMDTKLECGSWSKVPGKISFKITRNDNPKDWGPGVDWGGVNDNWDGKYDAVATVLSANAKEYTTLNMRGSADAPTNPGNVFVYDLVEGAEYTFSVNYISSTNYVGVKIAGEAAVGVDLALATNQVYEKDDEDAGVKKGDKIIYDLTRAGSVYTYEFIAEKSIDDFGFYVKGDAINANYTAELSSGKGVLQPITNEPIEASDYIAFPLVKDCKYKITIDASKGFAAAIGIEASPVAYLEDGKATIYGNWKYAENFYEVGVNGYSYAFKAENKDLKMKLIRVGGDYTMGWANATVSDNNVPVKLTYYAEKLEDAPYVKLTGLKTGSVYNLKFTSGENNSSDMTLAVEKLEEVSIEGYTLKGGWNCSWWGGKKFILTSESTQEYTIQTPEICSEHNGSCDAPTAAWGIYTSDNNDKTAWRADNVEFGKRTLLEYVERAAAKALDATMKTAFSAGRKYSIKIEQESKDPTDPKVYITITDLGPVEKKPAVSLLYGSNKKIDFENVSTADGPTDTYTYTLEGEALESVGPSVGVSSIKYGNDSYASATATTVELQKAVALVKDGKGSITIAIDTEAYKSYTFSIDFTDKASPKLTVSAVEKPKGPLDGIFLKGEFDNYGDGLALTMQDNGSYTVTFTAMDKETLYFKLASADWSIAYPCKSANDASAQTIAVGEKVAFYKGNSGYDNPLLTGLVANSDYVMTIVPDKDEEPTYVTINVKTAAIGLLDNILLRGELDNWGDGFPLESNGYKTSYSVEFTANAETVAFKLANSSWSVAYPCVSAEDNSAQTIAADGNEVKFYKGDSYPNNPSLTGLTSGKNYIMTIVPSEDGTYVTVTVSEK